MTSNHHQNDLTFRPPEEYDRFFTIFIPAFNREKVLGKTLDSVQRSTNQDFEVIIVDDGSTDKTQELAKRWQIEADFPIQYFHQKNSGKMRAHNRAVAHASGFLFMTLDAGDLLLPDALESLKAAWEKIPFRKREELGGIGALCLRDEGTLAGKPYPADGIEASYFDMLSATGEKRHAVRTTIMKQYPYPGIEGEKHIRIDLIFKRMAHRHKFWFINVPVQINRREEDGITANIKSYRFNNPKGFRLFYLEEITLNKLYYSWRKIFNDNWRYVQYSLHCNVGLKEQIKEVDNKFLWLVSIPVGVFKWLTNLYTLRKG